MKTIVELNSFNYASTGIIMLGIAGAARKAGYRVITYSPAGRSQKKNIDGHRFIGSKIERRISDKINTWTGKQGALNWFGTQKLLHELDRLKPDIIHLHNLHSNYVNLELLFAYIKKHNIRLVWTFHDCWPFTGHCPYFDIVGCNKWQTLCHNCDMYREYPAARVDRSSEMFQMKKRCFSGVRDAVLVTPSRWLADLAEKSFLQCYPIKVIPNGIDRELFRPRSGNFREAYGLESKFIVLSVAFSWGYRKGQDRLEALAERLDSRFQVVLVGISQESVKNKRVLCIPRTDSPEQLAEIYTAADVFLNATREDNFPTVNLEALACGTPVLSYGAGGSAEAFDEKSGAVIDDSSVVETLERLYQKNYAAQDCVARSKEFDREVKFKEYVAIYDALLAE